VETRNKNRYKSPCIEIIKFSPESTEGVFYLLDPASDTSDPESIPQMLGTDEKEAWLEAMEKEYNTLQENGTWILVPRPTNKKILTIVHFLIIVRCIN
jgi:hypothetical protein